MNFTLRLAISSIVFAAVACPAFAQNELAASAATDSDALVRAQTKFAHALEVSHRLDAIAQKQGYSDDAWRRDLIASLMGSNESAFASVAAATNIVDALGRAHSAGQQQLTTAAAKPKSLGTVDSDLVFVPIAPCRILDTRGTGAIPKATVESYVYSADNIGHGNCFVASAIPGGVYRPTAEAVNVTVDETGITGFPAGAFISFFPGDGTAGSSFLNFSPNQIVANAGIIAINQTTGIFSVRTSAPVNLIVDVFGVFVPPQATALDCVDTDKVAGTIPAGGRNLRLTSNACPATYTIVSGSCFGGNDLNYYLQESVKTASNTWLCNWESYNDEDSEDLAVSSTCCRVPGR